MQDYLNKLTLMREEELKKRETILKQKANEIQEGEEFDGESVPFVQVRLDDRLS